MIILVPNEATSKREELILIVRTRPEFFISTSHYLALLAADKIDDWILFDRPYGVLAQENEHTRLLDFEEGVERVVMRQHLELAMSHQFVLQVF